MGYFDALPDSVHPVGSTREGQLPPQREEEVDFLSSGLLPEDLLRVGCILFFSLPIRTF